MPADGASSPSFAELQRPLPVSSPRAWGFGAQAMASRAGGLISEGLRVGHRYGFDSGPFMAHVYANRPRGRGPLGRRLDQRLLRRPTCQAFREIRGLASEAVAAALDAEAEAIAAAAALDGQAAPVPVIADLAAGPAPYLFEALATRPQATAIVCDIAPAALAQAREEAQRAGVAARVQLVQASAFDRDALAALSPRPQIVVELGLYGIYHDDAQIAGHFKDLAATISPSQIVFNVQTQNPEIEHIARVWRDHRGDRCVWRLRPVEQILAWAADAGYAPVTITGDSHQIYRVGRLERRSQERS